MLDFSDLFNFTDTSQGTIALTVIVVFVIVVIAAWFVAMKLFIKAAKMKGHYLYGGTAPLWFVAVFATPILVGIYVAGLPDLSNEQGDYPMQDPYFDGYYQQPYDPYYGASYQSGPSSGYSSGFNSGFTSPTSYPIQYPPPGYGRHRR